MQVSLGAEQAMDTHCGTSVHNSLARFVLGGRHFYFQASWHETEFEINVTDGRQVWHGHASEEFIEDSLKPSEMELQEYMQLTRRALTVQDTTKKHFSYRLSQGESPTELYLTWRIKLGTTDSQVGFSVKGTLQLNMVKDGRTVVQQCLNSLIDSQTVLEKTNKELKAQNEALLSQRDNALEQLNLLVQEKKAMEQELYHKFVQVLNEKKKKIRELRSRGPPETVRVSDEEDARLTKPGQRRPASRMCDESEGDADDPDLNNKGTFSLTGPTPSLSLLGHDGEYTIRTSVRKRHRPQINSLRDEAAGGCSSAAAAETSFKERLMAHRTNEPQLNSSGARKRPNGGDEGRDDAAFSKPAAKKARADSNGSSESSSKKTAVASAVSKSSSRAAKRKSVSAEDLLDLCQ